MRAYLHEQSPHPLGKGAEVRLELLVVLVGVEADVLHDGRLGDQSKSIFLKS